MTILVTGSAGMIGSHLVRKLLNNGFNVIGIDRKTIKFDGNYRHFEIDLGNKESLNKVFNETKIDRIIHLAALAHSISGKKYPKSLYEHLNVSCAKNVFEIAQSYKIPVLFISTVDVYGFQKGSVKSDTICHPVTIYGKTKFKAEQILRNYACMFDIYRFSPVYTDEIKRDIQKRIYLKYPNLAYQIGNNTKYEVLSVNKAVDEMTGWCFKSPTNDVRIIKDDELLETKKYICCEKEFGRAKHVLRIPKMIANIIYYVCLILTFKNKYTYLLYKAVRPLRSE